MENIDSFFPSRIVEKIDKKKKRRLFKYEEYLPVGLNEQTNHYRYEKLCFTNSEIEICEGIEAELFCDDEEIICFI